MPSGHVRKRGERSWAIIIELGRDPVTGKRQRRHWETVRGTKRQAEERLREILAALKAGTAVEPHRETLGEYLERWLRDYGQARLAPKTLESYTDILRAFVIPALGHVPLQALQPAHLQSLYARLLESGRRDGRPGGLSPRTVHYIHRVIHRALEVAVKLQLVPRNVADAVEPPRARRPEATALDAEGARRLLEAADGHRLYPIIHLALHTGLRAGELLALRWEDVDLDRGILQVRRTLQRLRGQGLHVKEPKTERGRRTVALPASAVEVLRRHRRQQAEERLAAGPDYQDYGLVFCWQDGRPLDPYGWLTHAFRRLADRAGFPGLRFHDLRHTHATLLLLGGIHPRVAQERLGHSDIRTTLELYSHVVPGLQEAAAAKIDELLGHTGGRQLGVNGAKKPPSRRQS